MSALCLNIKSIDNINKLVTKINPDLPQAKRLLKDEKLMYFECYLLLLSKNRNQ